MAQAKSKFVESIKAISSRKWYVICLLLFCIGGGLWFYLKKPDQDKVVTTRLFTRGSSYFEPLKIEGFSSARIPYLKMTVENQTVSAKLDLGFDGMICLPSDTINVLKAKKFIRRARFCGLSGKTYESDIYEVEKICLENALFYPIMAEETNLEFENDIVLSGEERLESLGKIGWRLFRSFNLLLDCQQLTFALCDNLETLKKNGYAVDSFAEAPLLLDNGSIEFEAVTEKGILRCLLDTGCTWNILNKDLDSSSNHHRIFTFGNGDQSHLNPENKDLLVYDPDDDYVELSSFIIGGQELGPIKFDRIKCPFPVDAVIGMEFISSALIFIDFSKDKIYFLKNSPSEEIVAQVSNLANNESKEK
jgi:hypothetical protein